MNIVCPHCSQSLELTPEVLASLQGQPHLACPVCQGLMAVPPMMPTDSPPVPRRSAPARADLAMHAHRGMNRNMLVLGAVALLTLGGLAVFLASRNGGNIFNIFQNINNQIIHNSYFTQLIASGVTTEKDLKSIGDIRPYGDGFIGVSKEALTWEQAQDLVKRTGSEVLATEKGAVGSKQELLTWLGTTFSSHLASPVWVREQGEAGVLAGTEILASKEMDRQRKVMLHWRPVDAALAAATKDKPFVNKLGMKFVPVPDTKILMCIHETRRQDYAAYAAEVAGVEGSWKNPQRDNIPCGHENAHPVVNMSWEDAQRFCHWLSKKEGRTYRLPTDREWSYAVGIGPDEKWTKETKAASLPDAFPWDGTYPPKSEEQAGNYFDKVGKEKFPKAQFIEGYTDGFATTSPVMSFKPNKFGLFDLGGNVWEWCEDRYNDKQMELRGASWDNDDRNYLLSSCRFGWTPDTRTTVFGFRMVVEVSPTQANARSRDDPDRDRALALITQLGGTYEVDATSPQNPKPVIKVELVAKKVDDAALLQLKALPGLKSLNLNSCSDVGDASLTAVSNMTDLEMLNLGHCYKMTDQRLEHLRGLSRVSYLNLAECGYTGAGFVHLKGLTSLRVLIIAFCVNIEDRHLANLTSLTNLEDLNFERCEKLTDDAVDHIVKLSSLEKLNLAGTQVTDAGLRKLGSLRQLKEITLGGNGPLMQTKVTDDGVAALQKTLPDLKIIR